LRQHPLNRSTVGRSNTASTAPGSTKYCKASTRACGGATQPQVPVFFRQSDVDKYAQAGVRHEVGRIVDQRAAGYWQHCASDGSGASNAMTASTMARVGGSVRFGANIARREYIIRAAEFAGHRNLTVLDHVVAVVLRKALEHGLHAIARARASRA
jgi:hypothetical protein